MKRFLKQIRTIGWGLTSLCVGIAFFTLATVRQAQAAAFTATQTGNWNVGTTWGGACASSCVAGTDYPGASDTVTIGSTYTVTVPTAFTANFTSITVQGTATLKLTGQLSGTDLTVKTGATVQQDSTSLQTISGTLSVESGGTLTHTANATTQAYVVNFTAGTATIAGSVNVNAKGYQGGTSSVNAGSGPGGAAYTGTGGGGAAYGGNGGFGHTGVGATATGSLTAPADAGSGGSYGGSGAANGGAGGGLIKITATNLTLTGTMAANGGAGVAVSSFYTGSGGSGGGIYLSVSGAFDGTGGTITATGGTGTLLGGVGSGGGGGGRVAIVGYTTYTAPATFTAYGGAKAGGSAANGGAGSLYVKSSSNNGTATYNNNGSTDGTLSTLSNTSIDEISLKNGAGLSIPAGVGVTTTQSSLSNLTGVSTNIYLAGTFNPQNASFTISSSTNILFAPTASLQTVTNLTMNSVSSTLIRGVTHTLTDLTIGAGGTLTLASFTTSTSPLSVTNLTVNGTLTTSANTTTLAHIVHVSATTVTVGAVGTIHANAKGYQGGTSTVNAGSGPGGASYAGSGSGGGAYGGNGGYGAAGVGPSSVGSLTAPNDAGSGGAYGASAVAVGGAGGGLIKITATNLTLTGTMAANGGAGTTASTFYTGSGGSGGGIYLNVSGAFDGTGGTITATGGAGTTLGGYSSGGGGGGRVAIVGYTTYTAPATFTAYGGTKGGGSAGNGGAGSLFVKSSSNNGTATYNNNGSTDAAFSTLSNTDIDEIILRNGAGLSIPAGVSVTTTQSSFSNLTSVSTNIYLAGTFNPQNASFTISSSTAIWFAPTANLRSVTNLTVNSVSSTVVSGATHTLSALTIGAGATFTMDSYTTGTTPLTIPTITVDGTLTHTANLTSQAHTVNVSATDFTLSSGGAINVNSKGYRGGLAGSATGAGPGGASSTSAGGNGGAAHGGAGGNGTHSNGSTMTYDSAIAPEHVGSGGAYGGSTGANGGYGGGFIQINTTNLTAAGTMSANGQAGTTAASFYSGGGGSGGAIYLNVSGTFNGTGGSITANGGAGGVSTNGGGGGGGGRIAIGTLEGALADVGTITVTGGTKGAASAQDGYVGTKASRPNSTFVLGSSYTNLSLPATISGTSTYQFNAVSSVAITIRRVRDSLYWDGSGWGAPISWLVASGTSTWEYAFAGVGLDSAESYVVQSRATDSLAVTEATSPSSTFTYSADLAPAAPTSLAVSQVATSTLSVSWTDNSSGDSQETSFIVYRSTDDVTYTSAATLSADTTSAALTGLSANTLYYFKVTAANVSNGQSTSTAVTTTTHVNLPSGLTSDVSTSTISLTWSANGNAVGTVYEVLNNTTSTWSIATTTDTAYTVSGLTPNTAYNFGVRATQLNVAPTTYSSEAASATTTLPNPPSAPTTLIFSDVTSTTASLVWTDASATTNQETEVSIYKSTDGVTYTPYATTTYAADTTSASLTGLIPNTTYFFTVTASNVSGAATSTAASTSTLVVAPSAFTAGTATTSTIPLSWSMNGNATGTVFEVVNNTTSTWSIATTTATSYTVRGLEGNTAYTFGVRALQIASDPTSYSSEVTLSATTVSNIPTAPISLVLTNVATSTATLSWTDTASGSQQETAVYVLRSTDDASYSVIHTLAADVITAQITGLTPNQTYFFKVSVGNISGSAVSDAVSTSTAVMSPSGFGSGDTTTSTIPLTWSANGNVVGTIYEVLNQTTSTWSIATTTATSYTVRGLVYDTSYTFSLRAIQNQSAPTSYSSEVTYTTTTYLEVPNAPSSLALTTRTTSTATLTWTDNASGSTQEANVHILQSTDDVTYSTVTTLAADTLTTTVTGLVPNTLYYFKVSASNRSGSASSTAVSTSTEVAPPTTLTSSSVTSSTIPLTWSANGNAAGTIYEVRDVTGAPTSLATTTATTYSVSGLTPNTAYVFGVRAQQLNDSASYSAESTYATSTATVDTEAPTLTSITALDETSSTVTISWSTGEAASSKVIYSPDLSYASTTVEQDVSTRVTEHLVALTSLLPCVSYYYRVVSRDALGNAATSSAATFTTEGCVGDALVLAQTDASVPTSTGATLTLGAGDASVSLIIPVGYATSTTSLQIKQLEKDAVLGALATPSSYQATAAEHVFDFRPVTASYDTLQAPVQVVIHYAIEDVASLDETTLRIFGYVEESWSELSDCAVDTDTRTVTCETSSYSVLALFGQVLPSAEVPAATQTGGSAASWFMTPALVKPLGLGGQSALTFHVNSDALVTDKRVVTLRLTADPATVRGYAISLDPQFPRANLEPYAQTVAFLLPATPGRHTLYLRYYSLTGHPSETLTRTIDYSPVTQPAPGAKPTPPQAPVKKTPAPFVRTLKLRSVGEDVKRLQQFLNAQGCLIAKTGVGSKGKETTLFGPATQKAVTACQERNANELLMPAGLKKGTGVFGDLMRTWANKRLGV